MLEILREANRKRQAEWPGAEHVDIAFRALEVAGEAGEAAEAVKKYIRAKRGIHGSLASLDDVSDEIADTIIALDLLANDLDIDLGEAIKNKFNRTSDRYGLRTKL